MEAEYVRVSIDRGKHNVVKKVLAYEVPLLAAEFGHGNVTPSSLSDLPEHRKEVDPEAEYRRLERRYGMDPTGTPWVTGVYGQPFEGKLAAAIRKGGDLVQSPLTKKQSTRGKKPAQPADPLD